MFKISTFRRCKELTYRLRTQLTVRLSVIWLPGCRPGVVADENKGEGGIRTATYLFRVKYTTTA